MVLKSSETIGAEVKEITTDITLRRVIALTEHEPQLSDTGTLRYLITGSTASYLYSLATTATPIRILDAAGQELITLHEIFNQTSLEFGEPELIRPTPTNQNENPVNLIPPLNRQPSDLDIVPIAPEFTTAEEPMDEVIQIILQKSLPDDEKLTVHDPYNMDRNIGKTATQVQLTIPILDKEYQVIVDSPETIVEGKIRQLFTHESSKSNVGGPHPEAVKFSELINDDYLQSKVQSGPVRDFLKLVRNVEDPQPALALWQKIRALAPGRKLDQYPFPSHHSYWLSNDSMVKVINELLDTSQPDYDKIVFLSNLGMGVSITADHKGFRITRMIYGRPITEEPVDTEDYFQRYAEMIRDAISQGEPGYLIARRNRKFNEDYKIYI